MLGKSYKDQSYVKRAVNRMRQYLAREESQMKETRQENPGSQDTQIEVRPVSNADFVGLRDMLSRSSAESIYRRFHASFARVPEYILRRLAKEDGLGERRLVAGSEGRTIGHAMYSASKSGEAEVGVIVEDVWQRKGVGRLLVARLAAEAHDAGIEAFTCVSLWENRRVENLVKAHCPAATFESKDGSRFIRAPFDGAKPEEKGTVSDKNQRKGCA